MPSKIYPTLSYDLGDFDSFLSKYTEFSEEPDFHYLADAIFHELLPRKQESERRFGSGLGPWTFWALRNILVAKRTKAKQRPRATASFGFRLLPTPAHCDTLAPLVKEVPCTARDLYGYAGGGISDECNTIPSGLAANLSALGWSKSIKVLLDSLRTTSRIRPIASLLADHEKSILPPGFAPRVAEIIFRQQLEIAVLRETPCPHRALFLTYELSPESKAWVQWAREAHKRVIHIMHGQRLPTYQLTMATDLVLLSTVDEAWFRERVDPSVRIWNIGHPRLETIRQEVGLPTEPDQSRLPRIAFFSQPSEGDYTRELRLRDWQIIIGLKDRAEVRFRLHPREDRSEAIADLKRLKANFIELSDAGLKEDLAWCDAIASSWSTVSMEAAACGKGVFWTCSTPEKYLASNELRSHGIGVLLQRPEEWNIHLGAWDAGGWDWPVIVQEPVLRKLGIIGDSEKPWISRLGLQQ